MGVATAEAVRKYEVMALGMLQPQHTTTVDGDPGFGAWFGAVYVGFTPGWNQ
tara:strand:- start:61 stop:216 length:156 start_codon:yes stop_codon:yes gene_type:complete